MLDFRQSLINSTLHMVLKRLHYPQRWIGKVTVHTSDRRVLSGRVDEPKCDPGNTLSRDEIAAIALASGAHAVSLLRLSARCWRCA